MLATWLEVAWEHALAFGAGVAIGFVLSNRYRIVKRNGGDADGSR